MYNCKYCGKEFINRGQLASHTRFCEENSNKTTDVEYLCNFCGRMCIGIDKLHNHENHCKLNPNRKIRKNSSKNPDYLVSEYNKPRECYCSYCSKLCKNINSLKNHEVRCKYNPDRMVTTKPDNFTFLGKIPYNKGLTKETDHRIAKNAEAIRQYYTTHDGKFKGKHHTEETKQRIAKKLTEIDHENHNRYSWGKKGWYDGVFFMSTYELAYYIFMKDSNHTISRCKQRFKYFYNNKYHYYTPDFILDQKFIIEVKGLERPVDLVKYSVVPDLVIIKFDDILPMLDYVKRTYNIQSIENLYEIAY